MANLRQLVLLLSMLAIIPAKQFGQSPQIYINESFTDGRFDDVGAGDRGRNWEIFEGTAEINGEVTEASVGFFSPNGRGDRFSKSLARRAIEMGHKWSGAQWRKAGHKIAFDDPSQEVYVDKYDDVVVCRFTSFSDFATRDNRVGIEVAMLEYRTELCPHPDYCHDLSFEVEHAFWTSYYKAQLYGNVENTGDFDEHAVRYAHVAELTPEALKKEYRNECIWRNMPGTGKTNIEQWGELNYGDFLTDSEMNSMLDPENRYAIFSYVQVSLFVQDYQKANDYGDQFFLSPEATYDNAQVGILNLHLGVTKKSDFNLDYSIDSADAAILLDNWGRPDSVTIKTGDANNDNEVGMGDASPLIAFWSEPVADFFIHPEYDSPSGELILNLKNISYFSLSGPAGCMSGMAPDFTDMPVSRYVLGDHSLAFFTDSVWTCDSCNLGAILDAGLDPADLNIIYNYKGSGISDGTETGSGKIVLQETIDGCPGDEDILLEVPYVELLDYHWDHMPGTLADSLEENRYSITLLRYAESGQVTVSAVTAGQEERISGTFLFNMGILPDTVGQVSGPADAIAREGGYVYSIDPVENANYYIWEVPPGALIVEGDSTTSIEVTFADTAVSGLVSVAGVNDCGEGTGSRIEVTVTGTIGMDSPVAGDLDIYPNPASDRVFINLHQPDPGKAIYVITDIKGKVVQSGCISLNAGTGMIPAGALDPGIYFIRIKQQHRLWVGKLMKQ